MQELSSILKDFQKLKSFFNENLGLIVDVAMKKGINIFENGRGSSFDDCSLDAQVSIYNAYNNCLNRANPSKGGNVINVFWWELNKEFTSHVKENAVLGYVAPSLHCAVCGSTSIKITKPYDFSMDDFGDVYTFDALSNALVVDGFIVNDIKSLNRLLMQEGLHERIVEIKKSFVSSLVYQQIIAKLWKRYATTKNKYHLLKLNRLAIEDFYPESPKVQNVRDRFVCSKCGLSVAQREKNTFVSYDALVKQRGDVDSGNKDLLMNDIIGEDGIDVDAIIDTIDTIKKDSFYTDNGGDYYGEDEFLAYKDSAFSDIECTVVVSSLAGKISIDSIKLINILSANILPNGITREAYACRLIGCTEKELGRRRRSAMSEIKKAGLIPYCVLCRNGSIRKYILWCPRDVDIENSDYIKQCGILGTVLQLEKMVF